MSDFDSLIYNSQIFDSDRQTNVQVLPEGLSTQWGPSEISPSLFHGADWESEKQSQPQCPYPSDNLPPTGPDAGGSTFCSVLCVGAENKKVFKIEGDIVKPMSLFEGGFG